MKIILRKRTMTDAHVLIRDLLTELGFEQGASNARHLKVISTDTSSHVDVLLKHVSDGAELKIIATEFSLQHATFSDNPELAGFVTSKFIDRHPDATKEFVHQPEELNHLFTWN